MDIESYTSLITTQNSMKEKYMEFLNSVLDGGIGLGSLIETFDGVFDINNAAGNQLDIIGGLVGISRTLENIPSIGEQDMSDEEYRLMIRLQIAKNTWDGTNEGANLIYTDVFNGTEFGVVQEDNQNMTVTVTVFGDVSLRISEILQYTNSMLVPVGVGYTISTIGSDVDVEMFSGCLPSGTLQMDCVSAT